MPYTIKRIIWMSFGKNIIGHSAALIDNKLEAFSYNGTLYNSQSWINYLYNYVSLPS